MTKRNSRDAAPCGNPDTPIPEGLLYTREQLQTGMMPGLRPLIPAWHLVDGVIKMTYWHAVKYYGHTLMYAEKARIGCTFDEARTWVESYTHFRNRRLEDVLKWLLEAYPPFIQDIDKSFPQYRPWEMVRNRTSECPMPPMLEEVGHGAVVPHAVEDVIKPYVVLTSDQVLKKEYLTGIMLGEPGPFFEYVRSVGLEVMQARDESDAAMATGAGKQIRIHESIFNLAEMMIQDITKFLQRSRE